MAGELSFNFSDLYGHKYGFQNTRNLTTPEEKDQMALIDNEDLAKKAPPNTDPAIPRNIAIGFFILVMGIVLFSMGGGS